MLNGWLGAGHSVRLRGAKAAPGTLVLLLLVSALVPNLTHAQELLLPEWDYDPDPETSTLTKSLGYTASATYSFGNDTVSDTWSIAKSPLHWGVRGWLVAGAVAGATTGMIFTIDGDIRAASQDKPKFYEYGEKIRWVGNGPGLVALTGGMALVGVVFARPKERETARLLLEASAVGYGYTLFGKYTFGRSRPSTNRGPRDFNPYSGDVSMPSGEASSAFVMAGVITSQYPQWYWQITAYSLAAGVGIGRIALDAHWGSDILLSAALGIAVSKAVVQLKRVTARERPEPL
jgi:hypothetical protein